MSEIFEKMMEGVTSAYAEIAGIDIEAAKKVCESYRETMFGMVFSRGKKDEEAYIEVARAIHKCN